MIPIMKRIRIRKGLLWLFGICLSCLVSCKYNHFDAESAAVEYCECMEKNGSPKLYEYATAICDAELIKKNRYYRLLTIDLASEYLSKSVSSGAVDSTQKFALRFTQKQNQICCRAVLNCPK